MKEKLRPAVGYIRMSTDQQQDSPARQRQDIEALASRQGFRITRWYEDHGQTGTESSKRREFQKLLGDAKAGTFQAVLLSEQSRMSREDIFDAMQHWRKFRDAGVSIITCQRGELKFDNLGGVITAIGAFVAEAHQRAVGVGGSASPQPFLEVVGVVDVRAEPRAEHHQDHDPPDQ